MAAYYLFFPTEEGLIAEGFRSYLGIPCVFGPNWVYQDDVSRYLRERALRVYKPVNTRNTKKRLSPKSMSTLGQALCNALEYFDLRKLDVDEITYETHILDGYQAEMENGTFSVDMRKLKERTVTQRVDEFCNYVQWRHAKGLRSEFYVPTVTKSVPLSETKNSHGHRATRSTQSRVGKRRADPINLRLPTEAEKDKWLKGVRIKKGATKHLMCELIIESAIRRLECVEWRIDTLPTEKSKWQVKGARVTIKLTEGTKGEAHRFITLPVKIARRLYEYRTRVRPQLIKQWIAAATTSAAKEWRKANQPHRLFLSEYTLEPISYGSLYDAWKNSGYLPYEDWSPHLGRHYWACKQLLTELHRLAKQKGYVRRSDIPLDWITGNAESIITMVIQRQLGHIDAGTTQSYLLWAAEEFIATDLGNAYPSALEGQ